MQPTLAAIDPWIFAFSAATVIATIWMGFWSAKKSKTASDFFVAGRSVSVGWNASAISGEYLSAASFMGIAGMVMSSGYDALWYPVCYACGYLFLLLFIAGPLRRFGAYTIPDFAEGRYDSPVFRKIAVVFVLFIGFFYTMPQMKGAGTTLAYIFPGLPYWAGVVLVGAVITLNVALGGMKGITLVQAFQYWAKMLAISVPIFVLMAVYGHYGKQIGVNDPKSSTALASSRFHSFEELDSAFPRLLNPRRFKPEWPSPSLSQAIQSVQMAKAALRLNPISVNTTNADLPFLLNVYAGFTGKEIAVERLMPRLPGIAINTSRFLTRSGLRDEIQRLLEANGLRLLQLNATQAVWLTAQSFAMVAKKPVLPDEPLSTLAFPASAPPPAKTFSESLASLRKTDSEGSSSIEAPNLTIELPRGPRTQGFSMGPVTVRKQIGPIDIIVQGPIEKGAVVQSPSPVPPGGGSAGVVQAATAGISGVVKVGGNVMALPQPIASAIFQSATNRPSEKVERSIHREQLPEKAPKDETWLNPFGPLTTKAAKALKPQIVYDGPLQQMFYLSFGTNTMQGIQNLFKARFEQDRTGGLGGLGGLACRYAMATVLSEPLNLGREIRVLGSPSLLATPIVLNANPPAPTGLSYHEIAATTLATLTNNGYSVIREAGNAFKVFSTKEATLVPVDPKPYALLYTYSLIIALVCGTAGLPHILVRFYTNPDGVAAKRTTMWVMILIGVFYLFPPVFGAMGRNLFPELYSGIGAKGTDKIVLELPRLLNEKHGPLGSILSGITCAGAFAAFMSTFSGLLVSMTGALAHDVYGRMLRPKATPEQRMRMFRIGAVALGLGAIIAGSFVEPLQINFMVGQAFAIAAASYFPLLFMSCWWRKMTMKGAAAGMLAGGCAAMLAISLTSFSDLGWLKLADFWAAYPLLRILCEQPAIWAVPLAITLMVIVSKLTAKDVPSDIRMKMLVLHAPEKLGLKQEYIQEHQPGH